MSERRAKIISNTSQLEMLFNEYRTKLELYFDTLWRNFYWDWTPPAELGITTQERLAEWLASPSGFGAERERRGLENHRLHVEAYHAGEVYRGALREFVAR